MVINDELRLNQMEARRNEITRTTFPFKTPPQEILDGTYILRDESLGLPTSFHQTTSAILVLPRIDGRLLVPSIALGNDYPTLDLALMARDTLPKTSIGGRRWGVWCGKRILADEVQNNTAFTQERAQSCLEKVRSIKRTYQEMMMGNSCNLGGLRELLAGFVQGEWLDYYSQEIPEMITSGDSQMEQIVSGVFDGYKQNVERAQLVYENITPDERLLLTHAFNFTVQVKAARPYYYISDTIPALLQPGYPGLDEQFRNPQEILVDPRGINCQQVEAVYLPDQIEGTPLFKIATNKLEAYGIDNNRIKPNSDMKKQGVEVLNHCMLRYNRFTAGDLKNLITDGMIMHFLS